MRELLELFKTMAMFLYSELLMTKNEHAHQQSISCLMEEINKFENDLSLSLIDMFQVRKINCNQRHFQKIANIKKTQ